MTDQQLYLMVGVPLVVNAAMLTVLSFALNKRIDDLRTSFEARFTSIEGRLTALETSFNTRFDLVLGKLAELDTRLSVLEERSKR